MRPRSPEVALHIQKISNDNTSVLFELINFLLRHVVRPSDQVDALDLPVAF